MNKTRISIRINVLLYHYLSTLYLNTSNKINTNFVKLLFEIAKQHFQFQMENCNGGNQMTCPGLHRRSVVQAGKP